MPHFVEPSAALQLQHLEIRLGERLAHQGKCLGAGKHRDLEPSSGFLRWKYFTECPSRIAR
jgi:hypothetical protein